MDSILLLIKEVKAAKGSGEKGTYDVSFEEIWDTVVEYINSSDLDLVSEDKSSGTILAQRGINLANYGDNVAVFIEAISDVRTLVEVVHKKVEVVHKKAMETNIFGAWWDKRIIKHLDEKYKQEDDST